MKTMSKENDSDLPVYPNSAFNPNFRKILKDVSDEEAKELFNKQENQKTLDFFKNGGKIDGKRTI